ncbi:MAG: DUF4845 domain-containing protein [Gammaproteobacteria bacterium]|nr:DUF4845 domain-containing protein [Gammaproteobacteria bacterium]
MNSARSRQRGLSFAGWLILVVVSVVVITLALRIIPHYVDYYAISTVVDSLPRDHVHNMTKKAIRKAISRRLKVNNVRDLPVREIFTIVRGKGATRLELNYERRANLIGNMHVVMKFEKSFEFS